MKKKYLFMIIVLIAVGLLAGAFFIFKQSENSPSENPADNIIVGGDRDEHGCIGSAGYSWCEAKGKCLRPWEEPCEEEIACGIENCHGMDIVCGDKPAEICTEIYMLGDRCRQYAQCAFKDGVCQQEENPQFDNCKNCVEDCSKKYQEDQTEMFSCESQCL